MGRAKTIALGFVLLALPARLAAADLPAWMAGCWIEEKGDRWTEECWTDTRGGVMIGSGRTGKAGNVEHWEWMRVERSTDGALTFFGSPKGAPAVGFKATEADGKLITFVNAAHDYPQRVRYVVTETGLDAEVSLADGSKPERWSYKRTAGAAN